MISCYKINWLKKEQKKREVFIIMAEKYTSNALMRVQRMPLRNHDGGKVVRTSVRPTCVLLFTRSLSVTVCSLDRVNILSSARPRTIKLYASAQLISEDSQYRITELLNLSSMATSSGARVSCLDSSVEFSSSVLISLTFRGTNYKL